MKVVVIDIEKLKVLESAAQAKLAILQDNHERELTAKQKRGDERHAQLDSENTRIQSEYDALKAKAGQDKRRLTDSLAELESRVAKESHAGQELAIQVKSLALQRDAAQRELLAHTSDLHQVVKDHEISLARLHARKQSLNEENSDLKAKEAHYSSDLAQLKHRLEEARRELGETDSIIADLKHACSKSEHDRKAEKNHNAGIIAQMEKSLSERESIISKLKDECKRRDEELEQADQENQIKVFYN